MLYLVWLWTPCYREQRHQARPVVLEMCCLPASQMWGVTERVQRTLSACTFLVISMSTSGIAGVSLVISRVATGLQGLEKRAREMR